MKKAIALILFLAVSVTVFGQRQREDLTDKVLYEINKTRTMYGINALRINDLKSFEAHNLVLATYNQFKDSVDIPDDDTYRNFHSKRVETGIGSFLCISKDIGVFSSYVARGLASENSDLLNPLAYWATVSVIEDSKGRLYWTVILYR